ncbi:MAG: TRAM domain-containing protein [Nitrososphaerota archaeon]|nr:TRAM domain-containing protein [Nitrososphaerota archaeon]
MSDESGGGQDRPAESGPPGSQYFREKPVKVGDEMDVTISEVSRRGDGVTRVQGYVIFIPTGRQGQQARIRVTTIRPNFAIAEIVRSGAADS